MNAKTLIMSKGVFTWPCLELNKNLTLVYDFNFDWCREGTYIDADKWESTPEQINQMLTMTMDDIALPDDLYELAKQERCKWL